MKIVFVNPPHVRTETSNPSNDFKIDKMIISGKLLKLKGVRTFFKKLNKYFGLGSGVRYGVRAGSRWPWTTNLPLESPNFPFFMAYAAANVKKHGHEVSVLDAVAAENYNYQDFLNEIKREKADIVVVECSTPTIDIDVWFANKISTFAEVALAGPHLNDKTVAEIQLENPNISYYLFGEYILSSVEMAQTKRKGIYQARVVKNVDEIPFPYRNYKFADKYFDPSMPTPKPQLQIYGSKGCPFKCTFCAWPQNMYFGNVSLRDPKKIAEEIKEAVSLHGYKSIFFDDDTFNLGTNRISELCDYLKEIGLPWTMMGRLDVSPDWLYDKMVESGCVGMRFGIETFNLDVLKNVEKGIERKDFKGTLQHISSKYPKVMIHITMMKDMPGQTEEDHLLDMKIISDMGFSENNIYRSYQLSRCAPFPGTKLYEQMKAKLGEDKLKDYLSYDGGQDTVMKNLEL
jgi:anaerobic magnesium-protoporphyrin IX monomethyl ester cyclase